MPTYDYKCNNCGDTFEHFQKMTEKPLKICNKCGGQLKRLIGTGLGPIFKGAGFYQTDYKVTPDTTKKKSEVSTEKNDVNKKTEIVTKIKEKPE